MKKTFPLENPKHKPERVVAMVKGDVRKYLKRERRKKLPDDVDFWDFDCRAGKDADSATTIHVAELIPSIDLGAKEGWPEIYLEILAKPGRRSGPRKEQAANTKRRSRLIFTCAGDSPLLVG